MQSGSSLQKKRQRVDSSVSRPCECDHSNVNSSCLNESFLDRRLDHLERTSSDLFAPLLDMKLRHPLNVPLNSSRLPQLARPLALRSPVQGEGARKIDA